MYVCSGFANMESMFQNEKKMYLWKWVMLVSEELERNMCLISSRVRCSIEEKSTNVRKGKIRDSSALKEEEGCDLLQVMER